MPARMLGARKGAGEVAQAAARSNAAAARRLMRPNYDGQRLPLATLLQSAARIRARCPARSRREKLSEVFMKSWTMRVLVLALLVLCRAAAHAQSVPTTSHPSANPAVAPQESHNASAPEAKSEANLVLPDLGSVSFLNGAISGQKLLVWGLLVCVLGLLFGLVIYVQLKNMAVHRSMREISELIYEACKTYLLTQGRFLLILWVFIGVAVAVYFGKPATTIDPSTHEEVHGFPIGRV